MDLITALPKTRSGNTAIIVFVCRLTKMMHAFATVTECSAADVANLFLNTVFKLHGAPQEQTEIPGSPVPSGLRFASSCKFSVV